MSIQATCSLASKDCEADFVVPRRAEQSGSVQPWLIGCTVAVVLLILGCSGAIGGANKVTPENFNKVKRDMTEKEVVALLGPPQEGVPTNPGLDMQMKVLGKDAKKLSWQGQNNLTCHVILVKGTVQGALGSDGTNIYAPLLADDKNPGGNVPPIQFERPKQTGRGVVTKEMADAFSKLRVGMNEKQVIDLLGKPDNRNSIGAQEGVVKIPASVFLNWGPISRDHIKITLRADKVTSASGLFEGKRLSLKK